MMELMLLDKETMILQAIQANPFISQQELSQKTGLSRSAVAGYISQLTKKGQILGRAYILPGDNRVACIGGANVDRKATCLNPVRMQTSNPVTVEQSCGGVARNVAENLGRLGVPVSLITFVGDDREGEWLLAETQRRGVDTSQSYLLAEQRTGTYTAVIDDRGEMVLALADMQIYDGVDDAMIGARWPHLASSRYLFADTNLPKDVLHYLIRRCREEQLALCVNAVSAFKALKLPAELDGVELLILNRHEAEAMTGIQPESADAADAALRELHRRGAKRIVLTLGEEGLVWFDDGRTGKLLPDKVDVVDVTGAGDSLVAGVLFGLTEGETLEGACRSGMKCAALTLQTKQTVAELTPGVLRDSQQ